jgi:hypothetical protein
VIGYNLGKYKKAITAVVGAGIAFATLVVTSEPTAITSSEWLSGGIGLATALGVYRVGNAV